MPRSRRFGLRKAACEAATVAVCALLAVSSITSARAASGSERLDSLIAQLTLAEKISLVSGNGRGGYIGYVPAIARLGTPGFALTDGPAGVRNGTATAFPAPIALASSWDAALLEQVGHAMGDEARSKGQQVLLGPCINIQREPQGGRSFEGYGEDPFLVGKTAAAFIRGVQSAGVIACAKHFAANNQETNRGSVSADVDERTLREIYLPAFKMAVQEGGALSVMAAYNRLNGTYCSENADLLTTILKDEWGFRGFVVSDWGAVHSTLESALGGLDLEMPTPDFWGTKLKQAVTSGSVGKDVLDDKVRRILGAQLALGQWDPTWKSGATANTPEHQTLARTAAEEGTVLLKNSGVLPLAKGRVKTIAVIGPNAATNRYCGGGSAWVDPPYVVAPLEAMRKRAGPDGMTVTYALGADLDRAASQIPSESLDPAAVAGGQHGLKAEYFANTDLSGRPSLTRVEDNVANDWGQGSPAPAVPSDGFSARWTGTLTVPSSGKYRIGVASDDGSRLWVGGKLVVSAWTDHAAETHMADIDLVAGKRYSIKMEYYEKGASPPRP